MFDPDVECSSTSRRWTAPAWLAGRISHVPDPSSSVIPIAADTAWTARPGALIGPSGAVKWEGRAAGLSGAAHASPSEDGPTTARAATIVGVAPASAQTTTA